MAYTTPYYNTATDQRRRLSARRAGIARPYESQRAIPRSSELDDRLNLEAGDYLSIVTGVTGLLGNYTTMSNQGLGLDQEAPQMGISPTGEPIYTAGDFYNQAISAKPQGTTGGEIAGGILQGAGAGASFGVPGLIIGGALGGLTSIFGGSRRKKKQKREKRRALQQAISAQNTFNKSSLAFDQQQDTQQDYLDRLDTSGRIYNLYR